MNYGVVFCFAVGCQQAWKIALCELSLSVPANMKFAGSLKFVCEHESSSRFQSRRSAFKAWASIADGFVLGQTVPQIPMTPLRYAPKNISKTSGVPSAFSQGSPTHVPLRVSVMLSPYHMISKPCSTPWCQNVTGPHTDCRRKSSGN